MLVCIVYYLRFPFFFCNFLHSSKEKRIKKQNLGIAFEFLVPIDSSLSLPFFYFNLIHLLAVGGIWALCNYSSSYNGYKFPALA